MGKRGDRCCAGSTGDTLATLPKNWALCDPQTLTWNFPSSAAVEFSPVPLLSAFTLPPCWSTFPLNYQSSWPFYFLLIILTCDCFVICPQNTDLFLHSYFSLLSLAQHVTEPSFVVTVQLHGRRFTSAQSGRGFDSQTAPYAVCHGYGERMGRLLFTLGD